MKLLILYTALTVIVLSSCIKDEPLNREADIEEILVEGDAFIDRSISEDNRIELIMADKADLTQIVPIFTLSPGATVSPESGEVIDLSSGKEVIYTVTSQSGSYHKTYILKVGELRMKYGFEEWQTAGTGNYPYPILTDPVWSNANSGIVSALLLGKLKNFERYPTKDTTLCVNGQYAASLQSIQGDKIFGRDMAILAGNLFLGSFSGTLASPLKSLRLGRNHPKDIGKPTIFRGYYKYTPGAVMIKADGTEIAGAVDPMSMYAAVFRVSKDATLDKEYLDGETILTSERVVARAEWKPDAEYMSETEAINGFTEFSIPFIYTQPVDYDRYNYRLTIVCSSSKDGNLYEGAVGSTLIVDELEIVCEPID